MECSLSANFKFISEMRTCLNLWVDEDKPRSSDLYWQSIIALKSAPFNNKICEISNEFEHKIEIWLLNLDNINADDAEKLFKKLVRLLNTSLLFERCIFNFTKNYQDIPKFMCGFQHKIMDAIVTILNNRLAHQNNETGKLTNHFINLCKALPYTTPTFIYYLAKHDAVFSPGIKCLFDLAIFETLNIYCYAEMLEIALQHQTDPGLIDRMLMKANPKVLIGKGRENPPAHLTARFLSTEDLLKMIDYFPQECFSFKNSVGDTPLHVALNAKKGTEAIVAMAKKGGEDAIRAQDSNGNTIFHLVALRTNYSLLNFLFLATPKILGILNKFGYSALVYAIHKIDFDLIEMIVKEDASVALFPYNRKYIHFLLVGSMSTENLIKLIDYFPPESLYDKNSDGNTPLHIAVNENKSTEILMTMVKKGGKASIQAQDSQGNTIFHLMAMKTSSLEAFKAILNLTIVTSDILCIPNKFGSTALRFALQVHTDPELLEMLLTRIDPEARMGEDGKSTPLFLAANYQPPEILLKLIDYFSPKSFSVKNPDGYTPLHIALLKNKGPEALKAMAKKGGIAALQIKNKDGNTIFHLMAGKPEYSCELKALVAIAPNLLGIPNKQGITPVEHAMMVQKDPDLLFKLLKDASSAVKRTGDLMCGPVQWAPIVALAIANQSAENLAILIPLFSPESFSVNISEGNTPLHIALNNNKGAKVIVAMAKQGGEAALRAKNSDGDTILHLMAKMSKSSNGFKELIIMASPDILSLTNNHAWNVLELAMEHQKNLDLLKMMLEKANPADICRPQINFPLIHLAVRYQSAPNLEILIDYFPKECLLYKKEDGDVPLQTVFKYSREKFASSKALLKNLPDYEIDEGPKELIPVSRSCLIEVFDEARKALELEKDQKKKNEILIALKKINNCTCTCVRPNDTLLHIIIEERRLFPEQIKLLLKAGADPFLCNTGPKKWAPYDWIMKNGLRRSEFLSSVCHIHDDYEQLSEPSGVQLYNSIIHGDASALHNSLNMEMEDRKSTLKEILLKEHKYGLKSLLHISAQYNNPEIIQVLLKAGFNPNLTDEEGWTPLKVAAVRGNIYALKALSEPKAVKEANRKEALKFIDGWDVYIQEVSDKIKIWMGKGDKIDLITLLKSKNLREMILLRRELMCMMKHSVNANAKESKGVMMLIDSLPSLEILMQIALAALDLNIIPKTAFEILMQYGASLDVRDEQGRTALYRAAESANPQQLCQLVDLGPSLNLNGEAPICILIRNIGNQLAVSDSDRMTCIKALVNAGGVNAPDFDGKTIAHIIGNYGKLYTDDRQEQITSILIDLVKSDALKGLRWDLKDAKGKTGLDYARESGNNELIAAIENGGDIDSSHKI